MLKPHLERDVNENQERSKFYHDRKSAKRTRQFIISEKVKTQDYCGGDPRKKKVINGVTDNRENRTSEISN